jgi:three-Cys-motif partner protein
VISSLQRFGDKSWTQDKLERVRKYLVAYTTIMSKRDFKFAYIDGFAGTGYHELKQDDSPTELLLCDDGDKVEVEAFLDGSARIALQVEPRFNTYIFIEKSKKKAKELEKLRTEFPDRRNDIKIENKEANACLQKMCKQSWAKQRRALYRSVWNAADMGHCHGNR